MMKKSFLLPALFTAALCAAAPDLDRFFAVPDFRELPPETEILSEKVEDGVRTRSLTFRGADFNGKPTRIFAWYSCPEKPGKYPGVLQIHGAGLTTLDPNPRWAKQGFACLVIDWAGEGKKRKTPRTPPTSVFEEAGGMAARQDGEWHIFGTERDSIRNGVLFARRALEFLRNQPEVDSGRLLAVGSSAGAHLTLLLLGYEPELRAAVVKYGCGYIRDLPGYFGGYFGPLALSPKAEQDEWLGCFDPKQRIGRYKADVLLLSGTDDIFFWMPLVLKTYREMPGVKRLLIRPNDNLRVAGRPCAGGERGGGEAPLYRDSCSGAGAEAGSTGLQNDAGSVRVPRRIQSAVEARADGSRRRGVERGTSGGRFRRSAGRLCAA